MTKCAMCQNQAKIETCKKTYVTLCEHWAFVWVNIFVLFFEQNCVEHSYKSELLCLKINIPDHILHTGVEYDLPLLKNALINRFLTSISCLFGKSFVPHGCTPSEKKLYPTCTPFQTFCTPFETWTVGNPGWGWYTIKTSIVMKTREAVWWNKNKQFL